MERETIEIRIDDLTVADMEVLEEHAGHDALQAAMSGKVSFKVLAVLVFLAKRRLEPGLTLEAVRALKLSELPEVKLMGEEETNPTGAAG